MAYEITRPVEDHVDTLADGLGWFSIALGMIELVAPETLDRWLGASSQAVLGGSYGNQAFLPAA